MTVCFSVSLRSPCCDGRTDARANDIRPPTWGTPWPITVCVPHSASDVPSSPRPATPDVFPRQAPAQPLQHRYLDIELPHCALQALVGAARSEPNGTVRRAYASATAAVVKHAPDARVGKLVAEAVEMYTEVRGHAMTPVLQRTISP